MNNCPKCGSNRTTLEKEEFETYKGVKTGYKLKICNKCNSRFYVNYTTTGKRIELLDDKGLVTSIHVINNGKEKE